MNNTPKYPIHWQHRRRTPSCKPADWLYGKDFPEGSICLTHSALVVFEKGLDFASSPLIGIDYSYPLDIVRGEIFLNKLAIRDFAAFLTRMGLQRHLQDILIKWTAICKETKK